MAGSGSSGREAAEEAAATRRVSSASVQSGQVWIARWGGCGDVANSSGLCTVRCGAVRRGSRLVLYVVWMRERERERGGVREYVPMECARPIKELHHEWGSRVPVHLD